MSEIKNGGLDQYGVEPFERQQFATAGVEGLTGYFRQLGVIRALEPLAVYGRA